MFFLLLPTAVCLGAIIPAVFILVDQEDSPLARGLGCLFVASSPFAVECGCVAFKELVLPNGPKAFFAGVAWNLGIALVMTVAFTWRVI
jgi:hypothetical protein